MRKTFFQAASRPRGDLLHMPTILEWHEVRNDGEEAILASIKIIADVPQDTREQAKAYAQAQINELIKE